MNGEPFVNLPSGWTGLLRRRFWGFGAEQLPLNGRVWYPAGDGPYPLVLIVHGNHAMAEFSDPGYAYLGQLLLHPQFGQRQRRPYSARVGCGLDHGRNLTYS